MIPSIDQYNGELLCPKCKGNYLHHEKIEIFDRKEDEASGLHITSSNQRVLTDTNLSDNPSTRRHGLLIHFHCEQCPAISTLSVAQHKGNTFVKFTFSINEEQDE